MDYTFWVVQGMALIAALIGYLRTQKTDRRQFNLYHTYLCIPLMAQYFLLDAWFMFSLCLVGSLRTLILATEWGWNRRTVVVGLCLFVPVMGSIYTAAHWVDWFLLMATIIGVGAEALRSFFKLRIACLICDVAWMMNNFVFGGYVSGVAKLLTLFGHSQVLIRDFAVTLRLRAFFGCEKSKLAYLELHGSTSY